MGNEECDSRFREALLSQPVEELKANYAKILKVIKLDTMADTFGTLRKTIDIIESVIDEKEHEAFHERVARECAEAGVPDPHDILPT